MWSYEKAMEYVDNLIEETRVAYEQSSLPDIKYSQDSIDECCFDCVDMVNAAGRKNG